MNLNLDLETAKLMLDKLHNITFCEEDEDEDISNIQFVANKLEDIINNDD